jgi:hypothetical protein
MYVSEQQVFDQFEGALDAITITDAMAADVRSALAASHLATMEKQKRQAATYDEALRSLEVREDEIYGDLKRGVLDEAGHKRQLQKIRDERKHFAALLHDSQRHELDTYLQQANIALELAQNARILWNSRSPTEKRDFLKKLLWNPRLTPPTVEYELKKPFKLLAQMASSDKWGNRRGLNPRHPESQSGALPTELRLPLRCPPWWGESYETQVLANGRRAVNGKKLGISTG